MFSSGVRSYPKNHNSKILMLGESCLHLTLLKYTHTMTQYPVIVAIDTAIQSLAAGKGNPTEIASALTQGIKFMGDIIESLKEQNAELIEDTEELIEKVEELETDQEIILQFLQTQGIDISYIVRKEKSDDSDTSDNPN